MRITTAATTELTVRYIRNLLALSLAFSFLMLFTVSLAQATPLEEKQEQAAALDQQVSALEDKYSDLQEKHRGAKLDLDNVQKKLKNTREKLQSSKDELDEAKARLEHRALAIYRDGAGSTQLLELAKTGSFQEFFAKLETIDRVGTNDAKILKRVDVLTQRIATQEKQIRLARDRKVKLVKEIDKSAKSMQKTLVQQHAALSSVSAEIRGIMQRQRAAQAAELAAEGRKLAKTIEAGEVPTEDTQSNVTPAAIGATPSSIHSSPKAEASTSNSNTDKEEPSAEPLAVPLPPPSGSASSAAGIAMGKIGAPYVFGASGPDSFDCSGLVVWAFAQAGRSGLPHSTYSLIGMGVSVPYDQAQVGDLIFTNGSGHMGIYVGGGSFVHSPRTGRTVTVESLSRYTIVAIRRI